MGDLVKFLPLWLGLIATIALAAGGIAYAFAAAELKNAAGRQRLREALQAGGHWRRLYVQLLTPALDRLDRFLGDAGKAAFSLPSPFSNRDPHPYWTGWSFDRCALLALIYPLLSLFAVWVWTGESGPIAEFLGMKQGTVWWSRFLAAALTVFIAFAYWRAVRNTGWSSPLWAGAAAVGAAFAGAGAGAFAAAAAGALAFAVAASLSVAVALAFPVADAIAHSGVVAGAVGGCVVVIVAGAVAIAVSYCERRSVFGWFWAVYWPLVIVACYIGLISAVRVGAGEGVLSTALMFALIPIVNVPFDWASLGLTRALLRRGAEEGAPSPLWFGLLDFGFGLVLLALLALALIASLQMADAIIAHYGGKKVADVVALLDNIDANPRDPANYWAYATLFSTLIPSALNAVIGAVSLIGWWLPWVREWVLTQLSALDRDEGDEGIRFRVCSTLAVRSGPARR